jgi:hypothetical protein
MFVVAVSHGFNEKLGEIEQALQGARRGDRTEAMRALACAEAAVRDDSLQGDGAQGAISMMKHALRIRIEFGFPFDDAFWEAVDFIDNRADLPAVQRKIARRSLRGLALSIPSPSSDVAAWIATADTEMTSADIDALRRM